MTPILKPDIALETLELKDLIHIITHATSKELLEVRRQNEDKIGETSRKTTLLHEATKYGLLHKINQSFLTKEAFLTQTQEEEEDTIIDLALQYTIFQGKIDSIPKKILEDPEIMLKGKKGSLTTPLHKLCKKSIAQKAQSYRIPECFANCPQTLSLQGTKGNTPIHLLIESERIEEIPLKILQENPELLTAQNQEGNTPLHIAAKEFKTQKTDPSLYTPENLAVTNNQQESVLRQIVQFGGLRNIPAKFLTKETMILARDKQNKNIIDLILRNFAVYSFDIKHVPTHVLIQYQPLDTKEKETLQLALQKMPEVQKNLNRLKRQKRIINSQKSLIKLDFGQNCIK